MSPADTAARTSDTFSALAGLSKYADFSCASAGPMLAAFRPLSLTIFATAPRAAGAIRLNNGATLKPTAREIDAPTALMPGPSSDERMPPPPPSAEVPPPLNTPPSRLDNIPPPPCGNAFNNPCAPAGVPAMLDMPLSNKGPSAPRPLPTALLSAPSAGASLPMTFGAE